MVCRQPSIQKAIHIQLTSTRRQIDEGIIPHKTLWHIILSYMSDHITDEAILYKWGIQHDDAMINKDIIRNYVQYINKERYEIHKAKLELIIQYDFVESVPHIMEKCLSFVPGSEISCLNGSKFKLKKGIMALHMNPKKSGKSGRVL
ncbi:MAG TPA: hypothetical protein GXZ31_07085 [Thermoanaerobacterales bacterium]|nr:hypothetical protein [Thermoanaerobacterales bacterium]